MPPAFRRADPPYSPLYFLAALGNGGLAISFFVYLQFLLPHPETPIPVFADVWAALARGDAGSAAVAACLVAILWFAARHVRAMIWNLGACRAVRRHGDACAPAGGAEVAMMALPLAAAMTINVAFVLGAVFVPGLWSVVERLFPVALAGFAAVGAVALRILVRYLGRMLAEGGYGGADTAGFGQLVATFALAMVAVGFAAPAAMSATPAWVALGLLGSIAFLSIAGVLGLAWLVMGLRDVKAQGIAPEAAPSVWIVIPILTVAGIALLRLSHGISALWPGAASGAPPLPMMTAILAVQGLFGLLGWAVMTRVGYFARFLHGAERSAGSYALICPGVAAMVFGMFYIHAGLIPAGWIAPWGWAHLALMLPLAAAQAATIRTLLRLDRLHFGRDPFHPAAALHTLDKS